MSGEASLRKWIFNWTLRDSEMKLFQVRRWKILWTLKLKEWHFLFFFFFPLCHFQLSGQTKNSLHKQNSFSSWKMSPPLRKHVLPHPFLSGPTVVRTQRKPLGGKINLSLIKLEVLPWVYKKVKEGYTDLAVGGEGTTRRPLDFLPVAGAASRLREDLQDNHLGRFAPGPFCVTQYFFQCYVFLLLLTTSAFLIAGC